MDYIKIVLNNLEIYFQMDRASNMHAILKNYKVLLELLTTCRRESIIGVMTQMRTFQSYFGMYQITTLNMLSVMHNLHN